LIQSGETILGLLVKLNGKIILGMLEPYGWVRKMI
jgi:hypothetical protein